MLITYQLEPEGTIGTNANEDVFERCFKCYHECYKVSKGPPLALQLSPRAGQEEAKREQIREWMGWPNATQISVRDW
jgi:hypothetical protein